MKKERGRPSKEKIEVVKFQMDIPISLNSEIERVMPIVGLRKKRDFQEYAASIFIELIEEAVKGNEIGSMTPEGKFRGIISPPLGSARRYGERQRQERSVSSAPKPAAQ